MKKAVVFLITLVIAVGFAASSIAQQETDKQIVISPVNAKFSVEVKSVKRVYKVDESIRFSVKGNKKFYLYVFYIDKENNSATMILPNKLQKYNIYNPNKIIMVPEKNLTFSSDLAETANFVFVATTKELKINMNRYKSVGDFFSGSAKDTDEEIKAIRIRATEEKVDSFTKELSVVIVGKEDAEEVSSEASDETPFPFISADKVAYSLGDPVRIVYGANKSGFVYLFVRDEDEVQLLLEKTVEADKIYKQQATADEPLGEQEIIAVYSENRLKEKDAEGFANEWKTATKGLTLVREKHKLSYAVYKIKILDE